MKPERRWCCWHRERMRRGVRGRWRWRSVMRRSGRWCAVARVSVKLALRLACQLGMRTVRRLLVLRRLRLAVLVDRSDGANTFFLVHLVQRETSVPPPRPSSRSRR
jgi:hypothetical protein